MGDKKLIVMIGPFSVAKVRGGLTSVIASYMESSLVDKYEIHFMHTSSGGGILSKFQASIQAIFELIHVSVTRDVEVVHIHTASWRSFHRKLVYVYLAKMMRVKVLLHIHGGEFNLFFNSGGKLHRKIISDVLNISDFIVVLSESWLPNIQKMTKNQKIAPLMNPVKLENYKRNSTTEASSSAHFDIVFLGALCKAKGVYDLLEAFPKIQEQVPNAQLQMCGTGPIDEMKEICFQLGIENSVTFHGWISGDLKISQILKSDMLILPSYNEGLPVSVIEAMAAGLPVVCTPVGGVPDVFTDGVNGFLFTPGDKAGLVRQVVKLAKDPSLRKEMGETNLATAERLFDLEKIIMQLDSIYQKMSGERQ